MGTKNGCPVGTTMATTITVYASTKEVNVIIPGTGDRGEGNHFFPRPRGAVKSWVNTLIRQAIESEILGWSTRGYVIGTGTAEVERGKYTFRIYAYKFPMRVISGAGHGHHGWNLYRNDGRMVSFTWEHNNPTRITVRVHENGEWVHYTTILLMHAAGKALSESVWLAENAVDEWIESYGQRV